MTESQKYVDLMERLKHAENSAKEPPSSGSERRLVRRVGFFICRNCGGFWTTPVLISPKVSFGRDIIPATWAANCDCGKLAASWEGIQFPSTVTVMDAPNS